MVVRGCLTLTIRLLGGCGLCGLRIRCGRGFRSWGGGLFRAFGGRRILGGNCILGGSVLRPYGFREFVLRVSEVGFRFAWISHC